MVRKQLCLLAASTAMSCAAQASGWAPDGVFAAAGAAPSAGNSLTLGLQWNWAWRGRFGNTEAGGNTEAFVSRWSARTPAGRQALTQLGVVPVVRLRLEQGRSPWFLEGGIGISMTDSLYLTERKQFSTRFNFVDLFGVGRSLDAGRRHEVSVRLAHFSNANLRQPNPGETFLQLRYSRAF